MQMSRWSGRISRMAWRLSKNWRIARSGKSVLRYRLPHHGGSVAREWRKDYLTRGAIPEFDLYISASPAGPCSTNWSTGSAPARRYRSYCSFDPKEYRRFGVDQEFCLRPELHGDVCS